MPSIEVHKCKGKLEVALRRFKRLCDRLGVARRLREIEYYEKPTTKRKKANETAKKRQLKKNSKEQMPSMRRRARNVNKTKITIDDE